MNGNHLKIPIELRGFHFKKTKDFPYFKIKWNKHSHRIVLPSPEGAWNPKMTVHDCLDKKLFEAKAGKIKVHHAGTDATFTTRKRDTENELIISDMGTPKQELVRVIMKEPCWPFPPFCQQMGS